MVGFFPSTVRFRWIHYRSTGCDWVAGSEHECGCLGVWNVSTRVCGSVLPAHSLCWDLFGCRGMSHHQAYDMLRCLVSAWCPLDSTEQRMSTWETEWEIPFLFFLVIVASSLANKDKNIPSTFYVCTSQILLSSNSNGKVWSKLIFLLFPFSWHKQDRTLTPIGKVALSHYNNQFLLCMCVCTCVF